MATLLIAFSIFALAILAMALGVILRKDKKKGELRGSCGGPEINPDCCMNKEQEETALPIKNCRREK